MGVCHPPVGQRGPQLSVTVICGLVPPVEAGGAVQRLLPRISKWNPQAVDHASTLAHCWTTRPVILKA